MLTERIAVLALLFFATEVANAQTKITLHHVSDHWAEKPTWRAVATLPSGKKVTVEGSEQEGGFTALGRLVYQVRGDLGVTIEMDGVAEWSKGKASISFFHLGAKHYYEAVAWWKDGKESLGQYNSKVCRYETLGKIAYSWQDEFGVQIKVKE